MTQTFTLLFPHGEIAVLEVSGAQTQDEARSIAAFVLLPCKYDVLDGDVSGGQAFCFYTWANAQAQEPQPGASQQCQAEREQTQQCQSEQVRAILASGAPVAGERS